MKKIYSIFFVSALLLTTLTGCGSAAPMIDQTLPATTGVSESSPVMTKQVISMITGDEAVAIALKDAGFEKNQVYELDVELDLADGVPHYDVDFEKDQKEYDYEIHAETGKILKSEKERD